MHRGSEIRQRKGSIQGQLLCFPITSLTKSWCHRKEKMCECSNMYFLPREIMAVVGDSSPLRKEPKILFPVCLEGWWNVALL